MKRMKLGIREDTRSPEYQRQRNEKRRAILPGERLSPAECAIMELMIKGYAPKEAAEELGKSTRTVEGQLHTVRLKLRARTTVAAAVEYVERKRFGTL